jgi:hypothetical protein
MTFSKALEVLKRGGIVKRRKWHDEQWLMWLDTYTRILNKDRPCEIVRRNL